MPRIPSHGPPPGRAPGAPPVGRASAGQYAPTQKPEPVPAGDRTRGHRPPPPPARPATAPPAAKPPRPRRRGRRTVRVGKVVLILLLVLVLGGTGLLFYYDSRLDRIDALPAYAGRPSDTPGTNWLIVGTDSRSDLSDDQRTNLSTGDADGSRTDTIMLVHNPPGSGKATVVSIPRDLYVEIPGNGSLKVNAAYNIGGPALLVQTVENLTGIHIDHYAEIGFGGFDTLVDAVGGVDMCIDQPLNDPKAGLKLSKGCHHLNGRQALGLVRTRAFPRADLERVVNQRKFLAALVSRATSPAVLFNPFRLFGFIGGAIDALTVDERDHIWNLASLMFALRDPVTTTTPTGESVYTDDGLALPVTDRTEEFFGLLRAGQPIPDELLVDAR
ncbi:cell envelope-related function transcriptional attenuator common domain-containing protein [Gordonia westfalica]|uniref:Cell envelope-related function transcriptional attenuator common domain-containing protein n=1 Tax=Gordonia westfalica TaxID=158898 RepID=A0A1H2KS66_9ACTN|nr:LCP family protein [Gordonia westfalica]SDU71530.1 cell envelope-related function transcriptional attenuator common domain-containing protein [Gordonia westfalica]